MQQQLIVTTDCPTQQVHNNPNGSSLHTNNSGKENIVMSASLSIRDRPRLPPSAENHAFPLSHQRLHSLRDWSAMLPAKQFVIRYFTVFFVCQLQDIQAYSSTHLHSATCLPNGSNNDCRRDTSRCCTCDQSVHYLHRLCQLTLDRFQQNWIIRPRTAIKLSHNMTITCNEVLVKVPARCHTRRLRQALIQWRDLIAFDVNLLKHWKLNPIRQRAEFLNLLLITWFLPLKVVGWKTKYSKTQVATISGAMPLTLRIAG